MRSAGHPTRTVADSDAGCCASANAAGSVSRPQPRSTVSIGPAPTPSNSRSTGANVRPCCRSLSTPPHDSTRSTMSCVDGFRVDVGHSNRVRSRARTSPSSAHRSRHRQRRAAPAVVARGARPAAGHAAGIGALGMSSSRGDDHRLGRPHPSRAAIPRVGAGSRACRRPRTQVVFRAGGRHVARVDFLFDAFDVVVEVSGQKGHASPSERARDAQRRNELQDLGMRVYEYTFDDVTKRPGVGPPHAAGAPHPGWPPDRRLTRTCSSSFVLQLPADPVHPNCSANGWA